ncbi:MULTISPECIES: hypothetical protein [unclassified Fusibacter]|uniref:hypothetical protein n=1 Tax=unclassified Fusibacter TaxID=2624464 RepID=UPI0010139216|nr:MULTISPECIES: hypothetical protein [unclassified Fusibacter]MCK8060240.1 hypothetical protein [Fusibacter sp. A2]NPE22379.1 hypothetical protein [Fusibacter sp. A1]RXV61151.1 hypothetical protein DWB64_11075 [Fusibacter sp. A1]
MTTAIGILAIVFGLFFVSLGLLFVKYELSPFRLFVKPEDVFYRLNFGIRIMIPGFILFYLASVILQA